MHPPKPSTTLAALDQFVVGQTHAKQTLAVAAYTHALKSRLSEHGPRRDLHKNNVLLIGPTGTGKTLLCTTLARVLDLPCVTMDASALAQSRYVHEEIEALMLRLLEAAGGDLERAARGLVFIDEIDKLAMPGESSHSSHSVAGRAVQHALLKVMEGSLIRLAGHQVLDTQNILFLCGGAFVGIERIMQRSQSYGYIGTDHQEEKALMDRLNQRIKPTDLFEYGLIPEFTGRLPIIARLDPLSRSDLIRVIQEPQDSLYRQYQALFALEGAALSIELPVFEQMADLALEYQIGARSLRGLFEELLTPTLFNLPDEGRGMHYQFESLFRPVRKTLIAGPI